MEEESTELSGLAVLALGEEELEGGGGAFPRGVDVTGLANDEGGLAGAETVGSETVAA